ncbi:hypothetical protein WQ54_06780 [Bacillus sp. SA1-12]|uniref:hypothetical protein n=1 Tax=Bacillus sp. SA1-12 TaxID=1455638 RepID=UPI0006253626|nr:hypothetical protein [Bacillus sp. SA1-12]KKI92883.1 hypothetical protein WQ54_06780 [Bacillus sp. SA1-12]
MTKESTNRSNLQGKLKSSSSNQQRFNEEISMENLAKEALAETIREGGAFAREKSDRSKP